MLRFSALGLRNGKSEEEAWVYLESFLVHFRNLIEFLGMDKKKKRRDSDLHVEDMWQDEKLPPAGVLEQIHKTGKRLTAQYESYKTQGRISEYLAHCTTTRTVPKMWSIDTMYQEIEPALTEMEKYLKPSPEFGAFMRRVPPVEFREPLGASATGGTHTASGAKAIGTSEPNSLGTYSTGSDSPIFTIE